MKNRRFSSRFLLVTGLLFISITAVLWWIYLSYQPQRSIGLMALVSLLLFGLFLFIMHQYRRGTHDLLGKEHSLAANRQDLARSELRYRTLVENLHEGILLFDPTSQRTLYSNPAVADIFGKMRQEGITQPLEITRLLLPEDCRRLLALLRKQLEDPTPASGLYQARSVSGEALWLEIRTTRVEYEGRLVCVLLIENMTKRKNTEVALRESEERYRGIVNSVQDAILLEDHTGRILDANAGAVSMYGYSRDELLSKTVHELCAPDSIFVLARSPQELLKKAPGQPLEGTNMHASGQAFPVEVCVRPHTFHGQMVSLVVVRDITRRKQAEQAADTAHQKIDQLMVSIPDVLWSGETNRSGHFWFSYVSPVIQKISGCPADTFLERPERWLEIVHPGDREPVRAELKRFYTGSQPALELEYRLLRPDGSIRYVRDRQSARQTTIGLQVDGVLVDITEQKRVEQALKKANRDLSLTVKQLQIRHREVSLLNEMGDLLQSCLTLQDAHAVIGRFTAQLFPGQSGALYMFAEQSGQAEPVLVWGVKPPSHAPIATQDCLALSQARTQIYSRPGSMVRCTHIARLDNPGCVCAPLLSQGETIGVLHLASDDPIVQERTVQLAETLARQIALALSNLRLRESLRRQATQDSLTGLYNRRYMEENLTRIVSGKEAHRSLGIILLDIDQFKRCNDSFGHDAGDTLLRSFGQYLQRQFGSPCTACRYGGDEFVVLLPGHDLSETLHQAEKLRAGFHQMKVFHQGQQLHFNTLSLGVAAYPLHGNTLADLLRRADAALYQSKSAGGDQVIVARQ